MPGPRKVSSRNLRRILPPAKEMAPPPLPPEYTPEELIKEEKIPTVPLAHNPGWEKAGASGTI